MDGVALSGAHAAVLQRALALLADGVADAASPLRNMAVVTAGAPPSGIPLGGIPLGGARMGGAHWARMMVLRAVRDDPWALDFHTDARSGKVAALLADPRVGVLGWHQAARVQLRMTGTAALVDGAAREAIWDALPPHTRGTYAMGAAPGTPIAAPEDALRTLDDAAARAVFRVIRVRVDELEWLHLAAKQHQRARFTWAGGAVHATWLVP